MPACDALTGTLLSLFVNWIGNACLVAIVIAIAWARPNLGQHWLIPLERAWRRLTQHTVWSLLILGLGGFLLCAAINLLTGLFPPWGHDAYGYLLAADTFAQGRLTNPPHPLWQHFETFHTIHQPTYASKYPPLQGAVLALGQIIGHPHIGVWLATAGASLAVVWMLRAWLPARWAWLGGLLVLLHPVTLLWGTWYFGGTLALSAGALVIGAWRRLKDRPSAAWWLGIGIALLANCRPFEGLVLTLATGCVWLWRCRWRDLWRTALVLTLAGLWMGYYNWRITGSPGRMPYHVYEQQYGVAPLLLWQKPQHTPTYRHAVMREFHLGWDLHIYQKQQPLAGWLEVSCDKLQTYISGAFPMDIFGTPLIAVIGLAVALWAARLPAVTLVLLLFTLGLLASSWYNLHYAAPGFPLVLLIVLQALRRVSRLLIFLFIAGAVMTGLAAAVTLTRIPPTKFQQDRAAVIAQLKNTGGNHVVIVRYDTTHNPDDEWVFNAADIDRSPIIWARETGSTDLPKYYPDRHIWLLEPDATPFRLTRAVQD